ncbi:cobalamin-dependent protein [Nitrospinaceae bacterium]|jgi:anaerobic magnesium-protoporphyrin IX monomethyl ester cyclase|nr:cobalamin-dependent protein [Nitrospinaceae bacterium]
MITLIRFPWVSSIGTVNNEPSPPIGLAYLAGSLKEAGFKVAGIDATGESIDNHRPFEDTRLQYNGLSISEIVEKIPRDTRIIGISSTFSHEWTFIRAGIRQIKKSFPEAIIIAGGEHPSALPEYCLRDCLELDYIAHGEGEDTLVEFCKNIKNGQSLEFLEGICFLSNGEFVKNPARNRIRDVDKIPWPDWEIFNLETYFSAEKSFGASFGRNMPLMLSRGCPYQCTFCSNPQMWTTRYYLRSIDDVVNEIKFYRDRYQITGIQFYDLTAVIKKSWIIDFCKKLVEEDIKIDWSLPSGTRSEALDPEVLDWLWAANLKYLAYAPESASPTTLKLIKKKVEFPKMVESIRYAIKKGINLRANFIIGFPHETRWNIFETLRGQLKLVLMGVDEAPVFPFQAYPGMELFDGLVKKGEIVVNDDYLNGLATLSTGKFSPPDFCFSEHISKTELYIYRLAATIWMILLSYVVRPQRIARTIKNIFFTSKSATVLEQRLKDKIRKIFHSKPVTASEKPAKDLSTSSYS